jgi:NAD(P)-dependent dehydrogenase (short-subunit alcohol dehydrogenase family)
MTARLAGKRCLIAAAGAGIGRASALAFVGDWEPVVIDGGWSN